MDKNIDKEFGDLDFKILSVEMRNIRRIEYAHMVNEKGDYFLEVTGVNGAGKSSFIYGLELLFTGSKAGMIQDSLREGTESGYVTAETERYTIKREIWRDGRNALKSAFVITDKTRNNEIVSNPTKFLKELLGDAFFAPEDFYSKTASDRIVMLKNATGINFDELDLRREALVKSRTEIRRDKVREEGRLSAYQHLPESTPETRSSDEILADLKVLEKEFDRERNESELRKREEKRIDECRAAISRLGQSRAKMRIDLQKNQDEIRRLQAKNEDLVKDISYTESIIDQKSGELESLSAGMTKGYKVSQETIDRQGELRKELNDSALSARTIEEMKVRDSIRNEMLKMDGDIRKMSNEILEIEDEKRRILKEADFPIKGMAFGRSDIELDGIPFTSLSTAEKIKVSMMVGMMISNNKIKLVWIKDGAFLDDSSMSFLQGMANERKFFTVVETVKKTGGHAQLVIAEGRIENEK